MTGNKIIFIGWDCAAPALVFDKLLGGLPNVRKAMETGLWGRLRSCDPPITVPAWQVMFTGRGPGELGVYGFRSRKGNSYGDFSIVTSKSIKNEAIWDFLGKKGMNSIVSGVPPSYPVRPLKGSMIACFITPDFKKDSVYPESLKAEIIRITGEYPFDVVFRTEDKKAIAKECFEMTEKHFKVFEYLLSKNDWKLAAHVEIGLDRVQHGFWKYFDSGHHLHEPGSEYAGVIPEYYRLLDGWLGRIMEKADEDTLIIVASDHGAKRMKGAFCVNQWLEKEGYLRFNSRPSAGQKLESADVDWTKTKFWGWGGYYTRLFLNIKGREEQGIIEPENTGREIRGIKEKILNFTGPDGRKWNNRVYEPHEMYENPQGDKPDLMVYWDDLYWRSAGTVGHASMFLPENDTGPDDAVHE